MTRACSIQCKEGLLVRRFIAVDDSIESLAELKEERR